MGKLPPGKIRGSLDGAFSALRLFHEPTTLLCLDVLLPRAKTTITTSSTTTSSSSSSSSSGWNGKNQNNNMTSISSGTLPSLPSYELRFDDLLQSTVFRCSLGPQPLHQQQQQQLQSFPPPPPSIAKPTTAFPLMNSKPSSLSRNTPHGLGHGSSQSSAVTFPIIPHATRTSVFQQIIAEYRLNRDQRDVLGQVDAWFASPEEGTPIDPSQ